MVYKLCGFETVLESALMKYKRNEERALEASNNKAKLIFNRAKKYVKEYHQLVAFSNGADSAGGLYVLPELKLLFIIRILGINVMDPNTRKILQLLRLRQVFFS
ncbi:60S ribosomal protein L7 [Euphorbia peplus]|nr:60S ribosomal protein L7 [Euphorbia peplus]